MAEKKSFFLWSKMKRKQYLTTLIQDAMDVVQRVVKGEEWAFTLDQKKR